MSSRVAVEELVEDNFIRLRWLPGTGSRMVVSFTSLQSMKDGQPRDEFLSAASQGGKNNVLFVSDKKWSWYSRPDTMNRIVDYVKQISELEEITETYSIGNSMGGYGAMALAHFVPIKRVAAFVPQISLDSSIIDEPRWMKPRARHGTYPVASVADIIEGNGAEFFVSLGRNQRYDMAQADLLPDAENLDLYRLAGCAHDAAEKLKDAGLLNKVVAAKLAGDKGQLDALYDEFQRPSRETER